MSSATVGEVTTYVCPHCGGRHVWISAERVGAGLDCGALGVLPPEIDCRGRADDLEKLWQARIMGFSESDGWDWYHPHDSRKCAEGYPDLTGKNRAQGRVLWAELKTMTGQPTAQQYFYLADLQQMGYEAYLWRPSDEVEVRAILRARPERKEQ